MEEENQEVFKITYLIVEPTKSKIEEGIKIALKFKTHKQLNNIQWKLSYIIHTPKKKVNSGLSE